MNANDFVNKHSIRLAQESDLEAYQNFIKENSMAASIFRINFIRKDSLMSSFAEQGIQGFPVFLIDDKNQVCGFFSLGIRQAFLNGEKVSYGYLSDLRLGTKKMSRTLVEFRKIYRDIIESAHQIDEFKDIRFFLTSVLGDNLDALKALGRGRSGVLYKPVDTFKTQAMWIHPGYLLPANKNFKVTMEVFRNDLQVDQEGLCENPHSIANVVDVKVSVTYQNRVIFSALLAKPSLRKLELGLTISDKVQVSLTMNWMLQVEIDPQLSDSEYKQCMKALVKKLISTKKIGIGSYLLFKTQTSVPSMFLAKEMISQIFQVGTAEQNLDYLNNQKIKLESCFL